MFVGTVQIKWEYENELDCDGVTDGMFNASEIIDDVLMYPYVIIEGTKYYLEKMANR